MTRELGEISQKVILLLEAGLVLGLSRNPRNYFRILRMAGREWDEIDKKALHRAIKQIYKSKLIDIKEEKDGAVTLILTENGKKKALKYKLEEISIPEMKNWDAKWRVVMFDIPESRKKIRDVLRFHLKKMNFFEFQKSVFVHPFECKNEIEYLIEFYNIRSYVRFLIAEDIDNALHLRKHFDLV